MSVRNFISSNPVSYSLSRLAGHINRQLEKVPAWKLVLTTIFLKYAYDKIQDARQRYTCHELKQKAVKKISEMPFVRALVAAKLNKEKEKIVDEIKSVKEKYSPVQMELPENPKTEKDILDAYELKKSKSKIDATDGRASGTLYHNNKKLLEFQAKVASRTLFTNPLHFNVDAHLIRMETEVVRMIGDLYNGDEKVCGNVTAGGTLSIIHACFAYREYKGVKNPNMVIPESAHASFEKAGKMFGIKVIKIPVDPKTSQVDCKKLEKAIDSRTLMIVGSAPSFPHGVIDPIEELSKIAIKKKVPLHVDACLGSLLVPFAQLQEPFDFSLEGVASISCDTHKYGYCPKGSSVIMYRDKKYHQAQFFNHTDWTGGVYSTPTIPGSRSGMPIATAHSTLLYMGKEGYRRVAAQIIQLRQEIQELIEKKIPELEVIGNPKLGVLAMRSKQVNVYAVVDELKERGWEFNALQNPASFHFCFSWVQVEKDADGSFKKIFIEDLKKAVETAKENPESKSSTVKLYGTTNSVPKTFVDEVANAHWSEMYS